MDISIPTRINHKLQQEAERYAGIVALGKNIEMYYTLSPKFFPDYTMHGILHINMVLRMADRLIPDDALSKMSSRDVAILVAAIMIHDIGMFVTEDGLNELLTMKNAVHLVRDLDTTTWMDEWNSYNQKIKRYSDRELLRAFGDYTPLDTVCTEPAKMVRKDYLVCGEFIRQQHHRLAHDIAVNSFPGTQNQNIFADTKFSLAERDIIGLIARSHGMAVRDTELYISQKFADPVKPNSIPVFYLMVILRLADYLDAGQHRAPKELERRQAIPVPISQQEWLWNQQVDAKDYSWQPEQKNLFIQAEPQSTSEFIKIEKWLKSVQQELDISWSIIAEKYGGAAYQLSIHRIESNLLRPETRQTMNKRFLTKEAKLVANVDLLKLLIQPLYGDDPTFGVRELIQNATDACIERKHLEEPSAGYQPEVAILIDTKGKTFTIKDNGIGMNEDVLLHYYLSAGSSYRFSDEWLKNFSQDRTPMIPRTGKFGVGVLSTFLLGSTILVQTRHINDLLGYEFSFSLEQESIDIRRVNCEIGTTITIVLSGEVLHALCHPHFNYSYKHKDWFAWHHFREPPVRYYIDGKEEHKDREFVPQTNDIQPGWFSFDTKDYKAFQWKYEEVSHQYCNGIAIPDSRYHRIGTTTGLEMRPPSISLVDPACNLNVDLARSSVLRFPNEESFMVEAYKYYLAKLLTVCWDGIDDAGRNIREGFFYQKYSRYASYIGCRYVLSSEGYTLLSAPFLCKTDLGGILLACYKPSGDMNTLSLLHPRIPLCISPMEKSKEAISFYRNVVNGNVMKDPLIVPGYKVTVCLCRFWGEKTSFDEKRSKLQKFFFVQNQGVATHEAFYRYDSRQYPAPLPLVEADLDPKLFPVIAQYNIRVESTLKNNIMFEMIKRYLGDDIWIPYDMQEREAKFPYAFQELKRYMEG